MGEISVQGSFRGKNVLLTGATGFLGKVWLCLALERLPEIGRIHVLVRSKFGQSAKSRLEKILNSSFVFSKLHQGLQEKFGDLVRERIRVEEGDVTLPSFGISDDALRGLAGKVDLILHCAGLVDFSPDLRDAYRINVQGSLHALELARQLGCPLLHVSTAFVRGSKSGEVEEECQPNYHPLGADFDPARELSELEGVVNDATEKSWVDLGLERAKRLGWPNAYAYTKSLAESLLIDRAGEVPVCLFRPTIVESSLRFPFPGWNEGITTCAPLSYLAAHWARFLPIKPNHTLDIIPVDLACEGMTLAAAALLKGEARPVYHCGTSQLNPLSQKFAIELMGLNHRQYFQAHGKGSFERLFLARAEPMILREGSFFTATNLKKLSALAVELADLVSPHLSPRVRTAVDRGKGALRRLKWQMIKAERVLEAFKPFLLDHDYLFRTENLRSHRVREPDFRFEPEKISWSDYIVHVHEPGLRRWCYPLIEGRPVEKHEAPHPCSIFETTRRPHVA